MRPGPSQNRVDDETAFLVLQDSPRQHRPRVEPLIGRIEDLDTGSPVAEAIDRECGRVDADPPVLHANKWAAYIMKSCPHTSSI